MPDSVTPRSPLDQQTSSEDNGNNGSSRPFFLGLDIGSVNARVAVVSQEGQLLHLDSQRLSSGPVSAVRILVDRVLERFPISHLGGAAATGSGRQLYAGQSGWQLFSSPYAAIVGLLHDHPDARTIIEIGGQSALVIGLAGGLEQPWRVARSPLCAAGTGRFLEQQASRLGITIEEFGPRSLEWEQAPPRIAARCSVFAKSDLIHLQQKGWPVSAMLAGLSDSVARMIVAQWRDNFEPPIYCLGGGAANEGVVRALSNALGGTPVIVPEEHASREAIGAALLARSSKVAPGTLAPQQAGEGELYLISQRLEKRPSLNGWEPTELRTDVLDAWLGVDVGSTSTKAALVDREGRVLAKNYLMTAGQPLEAIKQLMEQLAPRVEGRVRVRATGVTGSGRYLVGSFIGADLIKNEITAQTRAALQLDPEVSTIFELGGQDSKYVYLENGVVLDYQMNKACAAGTGSFIDELAEQLGTSTRTGEFARLAFGAEAQLDLGEKCTAFMSQAVTSAQHAGAPLGVVAASLSTSLAKNYHSKVVGGRRVGNRIFLTGAVFYNEAVVAAFGAEFPGRTLVVPEHKEVTGAIGAALLAMEAQPQEVPSTFRGFSAIATASYKLTNFNCKKCDHTCAISMMVLDSGEKLYYGSRCDLFDAMSRGPRAATGNVGKGLVPFRNSAGGQSNVASWLAPDVSGSPAENASGLVPDATPLATSGDVPLRRAVPAGGGAQGPTLQASGAASPFAQREALLMAGYAPSLGTGPLVGVPRALMSFDLAPMLTGFLNALGVRVIYSPGTNKGIIESSLERAYTDSCFPMKLLHGHVAHLLQAQVDYVLIPNAIRMGRKQGDEDQRYSCPLVQAAPYIIRSVFDMGEKLLDPVIDLSVSDQLLMDSLAEMARRMGFSQEQGQEAASKGMEAQRAFERGIAEAGRDLLQRLESDPGAIGVVLLSRAYNAQDAGANLGMSQELERLGVVPIPLDFLPLDGIDIREISDRPYWNYERKLLAAARLIAGHPRLFGLFLSNFGCGPNSIIQNIVEDIMGGKPLGQIEVDEHAAEAGYITRLEALVDTLRGYRNSGLQRSGSPADYARRVPSSVRSGQNVIVVRMSEHAEVVAAAMRSFGVNAMVPEESDERSMAMSRDVTNGKECLPFRDTLGVLLRMAADGAIPDRGRALMAGSFGPCRLGKYAQEQQKILDSQGIQLEIMTTVSNNAYSDLGLGAGFELLAWKGVVAMDHLQRLLWSTRPYERFAGQTEELYRAATAKLVATVAAKGDVGRLMRDTAASFLELRDPSLPKRPLVGINGEIYLRANRFCNKDLVVVCEAAGLEAEVAPMSEWLKYVTVRNLEDGWANREWARMMKGAIRRLALSHYEDKVASWFDIALHEREPAIKELLAASSSYLPARNGSEAVLSLGSGLRQMASPHYAGVISVMPHGCMPGGIVAAFAEGISKRYAKPWISLTYDGFEDKVNPERIADLAEQLRHTARPR